MANAGLRVPPHFAVSAQKEGRDGTQRQQHDLSWLAITELDYAVLPLWRQVERMFGPQPRPIGNALATRSAWKALL